MRMVLCVLSIGVIVLPVLIASTALIVLLLLVILVLIIVLLLLLVLIIILLLVTVVLLIVLVVVLLVVLLLGGAFVGCTAFHEVLVGPVRVVLGEKLLRLCGLLLCSTSSHVVSRAELLLLERRLGILILLARLGFVSTSIVEII